MPELYVEGLGLAAILGGLSAAGYGLFRASPLPPAGFIPSPEDMTARKERAPFARVWYDDTGRFKELKKEFRKVVIPPIDTSHLLAASRWNAASSFGRANNPKVIQKIVDYMHARFVEAVANHPTHALGFAKLAIRDWAREYAELGATDFDHKVAGASPFRFVPW